MPWVVGVDEAGYGPNLGPLVQSAVAVRLPDADPAGWDALAGCVRRAHETADGRLLVDDSKKVYAGAKGLAKLEGGVFGGLGLSAASVAELVQTVGLRAVADRLAEEAWYDAAEALPLFPHTDSPWKEDPPRVAVANVVPAPAFNAIVTGSGSKGTVLAGGLVELVAETMTRLPAGEAVHVVGDKQGGRNFYAPLLQAAFPTGWVVALAEGAAESRYRVDGLDRDVTVVFRPRADADSVAVALASMLAKYLREVCMRQFNRYWAGHVPGLKPTAGYPVDAKRFYAAIRPAMERLGTPEAAVWRVK
jgi:hypothetical protein